MMKYVESSGNNVHSVGYTYDDINNLTKLVEIIGTVERETSYTYDDDNRPTSVSTQDSSRSYTYDSFGRVSTDETKQNDTTLFNRNYTYQGTSGGGTSGLPYRVTYSGDNFARSFTVLRNASGNIVSMNEETHTNTFVYDSADQLIRENNRAANTTTIWTYDNAGNILKREVYPRCTGTPDPADKLYEVNYTYGDDDWGDLLTAYNGVPITHDEIGNPLNDGTWAYTWQHGRQLASMAKLDQSVQWQFAYNANGMRTQRTNGTITYNYTYLGSQLTHMTVGKHTLYFAYDAAGVPLSLTYDGESYYYVTNIQGDVVAILDDTGNEVVCYAYDAWGNLISTTDLVENTVGLHNPLRYRGYVYDVETELYYLQSRYYNPEMGRFINGDAQVNTSLGISGINQFSYCLNNPVNMVDYGGNKPGDLFDTMDEAARDFAEYINKTSIEVDREYASYVYTKRVWETQTVTYYNPNLFGNNLLSHFWNYIFGGRISKTVNKRVRATKYTYVKPTKGTATGAKIPKNRFGIHNQVAFLHTHGAYSPEYANDIFSSKDINFANQNNMPIYVATPLGTLRKYNPLNGTDIVLYDDLCFDPKHPGR